MAGFRKILGSFVLLIVTVPMMAAEGPTAAPQSLPDPAEILEKILEKYGACTSFSGEADQIKTTIIKNDSDEDRKTAKFWFKRPKLLRVDWTGRLPLAPEVIGINSIFVKDGQAYTFRDFRRGTFFEKRAYVEKAIAAQYTLSDQLVHNVPTMLLRNSPFKDYTWTLGNDIRFDGQDCFVLNSNFANVGTVTMQWVVSKTSFTVLQIKRTTKTSADDVKRSVEQERKYLLANYSPMVALIAGGEYSDVEEEITTHYKNIVWEPALEETDFEYPVPKGTELTTDEEIMKQAMRMIKKDKGIKNDKKKRDRAKNLISSEGAP
jgi:outer membrane lipoprotein-sorting protein